MRSPLAASCTRVSVALTLLVVAATRRYIDPKYDFPPQAAVLLAVRRIAMKHAKDPQCLLLFGCYSIGKERVFMDVARALGERVYVDKTRYRAMSCFEWDMADSELKTALVQRCRHSGG